MKGSLLTGIAFTLISLVSGQSMEQQQAYKRYLNHPWVDSVLSTLSRKEQMAQSLWMVADPDDGFPEILEGTRFITEYGIAGLIFTKRPNEQLLELASYCQSLSRIPLALALEGRWSEDYPDMMTLSAMADEPIRYLAGVNLAVQLKKQGVSVVLAGELDEAVSEGLRTHHIQVLDPGGMQTARMGRMDEDLPTQLPDDSIEFHARQVLALKYWIKQQDKGTLGVKQEVMSESGPGQAAFIRDLYARSLTVLSNREQLIPLKDLEKTHIACLAINQQSPTPFQKKVGLYTRTDTYFWVPGSHGDSDLVDRLAHYDLVLAGVYPGQDPQATGQLLSSLAQQTILILVWFGDPADLEDILQNSSSGTFLDPEALMLSYEQTPMTESLSAQLIFGGIGGSGRLPVAMGERFEAGHGITTPGGLRLQYGFPENAGLSSLKLNQKIDSIVMRGLEEGAYPGCQVIVARRGIVIFHKAYGYHTYDKRIEVRKHDLYDLASVTKVTGPLSGLMLLEGSGKFSHQGSLGDYCSAMKGSDKASLALKDILAHRAGLYPWIPYHERTLKKNGQYKKRFLRPDAGGRFTVQVADRLYLSDTYKAKIFKEIRKSELGEQSYRYSGLSFFLFPTIIEELAGQPYESFLAENIYRRLGAWELLYHPRSSFPASRIVPTEYDSLFRKQLVHGYVHDEGAALMGAYAGNAGLFASSNDLLKLMEMYRRMGSYGGEQIIPSEVLREYSSYQFPELEIRRGLGFDKPLLNENDGTPDDYPCPGASPSSFGHSGFTGTFVWADPEHEISYVFLSNRVHTTRTNQLLYEMNIRTNILQTVYDAITEP